MGHFLPKNSSLFRRYKASKLKKKIGGKITCFFFLEKGGRIRIIAGGIGDGTVDGEGEKQIGEAELQVNFFSALFLDRVEPR